MGVPGPVPRYVQASADSSGLALDHQCSHSLLPVPACHPPCSCVDPQGWGRESPFQVMFPTPPPQGGEFGSKIAPLPGTQLQSLSRSPAQIPRGAVGG